MKILNDFTEMKLIYVQGELGSYLPYLSVQGSHSMKTV